MNETTMHEREAVNELLKRLPTLDLALRADLHRSMAEFGDYHMMDIKRGFPPYNKRLIRCYWHVRFALGRMPIRWKARVLYKGPSSAIDSFLMGVWQKQVAWRNARARSRIAKINPALLDPATWESMTDAEFLAIWDDRKH